MLSRLLVQGGARATAARAASVLASRVHAAAPPSARDEGNAPAVWSRPAGKGMGAAGIGFGSSVGMATWGSSRGLTTSSQGQGQQVPADLTSLGVDVPVASVDESTMAAVQAGADLTDYVAASVADAYLPVKGAVYLMDNIHTVSGLPWWLTIVATTVVLRTALLPVVISQMQNTARMTVMRPEMEKLVNRMKAQQAAGNGDSAAVAAYQRDLGKLWAKHNCHPVKSLVSIVFQAPVFISMFVGIQRLADHVPSFKEGGTLWFTDLAANDPMYLLPLLSGGLFLATVELGVADGMGGQPQMGMMKNIMRGIAVAMVPLTGYLPQGVFIYWITSNAMSAVQVVVLKVPGFKSALGIPDVPPQGPDAATAPVTPASVIKAAPASTYVEKPKPAARAGGGGRTRGGKGRNK